PPETGSRLGKHAPDSSEQFHAVRPVKTHGGTRELANVPPALLARVPTGMHDLHRGQICDAGFLARAQRQVKIFEIEEVSWIEASKLPQNISAKEHEAATDDWWLPIDLTLRLRAHL